MSLDRDISLLSRIPLFAGLSTEQLRLLAFSAVRLELHPGQVLFREGATAMSGYVVAFGGIELATGHGTKRNILMTCEAGSLIGEIALFIETRRPVTATAVVSCEVLEIDRKLMTRMLNEYPHVALKLRATLAGRLVATVGELGKVDKALRGIDDTPLRRKDSA
ncbi:MAG: cyclic nucleotide-binding domain-containing protein [Bauldia sp.]|uniref:cyclic nucleotide-binding domain-containing protein n=1 Tax=Bauldia sp. TaxID=2575872 RepID=UPI001DF6C432|nr:cyclic nucleotide-binding domain-containing protein [Bauldia sp.]MCB1497849.1 cyclic nucleotide-binding domain-containing protein [Bauldia sp.]